MSPNAIVIAQTVVARAQRLLRRFIRARKGNFAIMTALVLPVIILGALTVVAGSMLYAKRLQLQNAARLACNRAVKPTRMKIYDDSARKAFAETVFDEIAGKTNLTITSRSVTADWLTATVSATATFDFVGGLSQTRNYPIQVTETCKGVPPYPALGDVILSSNFTQADGSQLLLAQGNWTVAKPEAFGWDGGTGPGVEIQDWGNRDFGSLPDGISSRYVVELDSHGGTLNNPGNSSMYRITELHRGTYRFSFWYFGRVDDPATNRISVYIEGIRPVSPKVQKLTVAEPKSAGWIYKSFDIDVPQYSIYKFIIAAEGKDDTYGGNFNDLRLTYIKRPAPQYND